jgi:hypothetical protein
LRKAWNAASLARALDSTFGGVGPRLAIGGGLEEVARTAEERAHDQALSRTTALQTLGGMVLEVEAHTLTLTGVNLPGNG